MCAARCYPMRRMNPSDAIVVLCSCADTDTATRLAEQLVQSHLAACVNILPGITSVYHWQGQLQKEAEVLLMIKTLSPRFDALKKALIELHPYEVPEIIALPVTNASEPYLQWMGQSLT